VTPGDAVRKFCIDCVGGVPYDVRDCGGDKCLNGGCDSNGICLFFKYRMRKGGPSVRLIKRICKWCQGEDKDSGALVKDCPTEECALHPFRMGKNPNFSEETRLKRRERAISQKSILNCQTVPD
jgi:hypothetical protein